MEQECLKIVLYSVTHTGVAADFERAGLLPAGGRGRAGHKHPDFYLDLQRRLDSTDFPVNEPGRDPRAAEGRYPNRAAVEIPRWTTFRAARQGFGPLLTRLAQSGLHRALLAYWHTSCQMAFAGGLWNSPSRAL